MTTRQAARRELEARVQERIDQDDYDAAVRLIEAAGERRALTAAELVWKGRFIQLGSEQGVALDEARKAFEAALEIAPGDPSALIELGWYWHAIEDEPNRALDYFEQAIAGATALLQEAGSGKADCLQEIESPAAAEAFSTTLRGRRSRLSRNRAGEASLGRDHSGRPQGEGHERRFPAPAAPASRGVGPRPAGGWAVSRSAPRSARSGVPYPWVAARSAARRHPV